MPIAPSSRRDRDRIDWRQVDATTEAEIAQQAATDPDTAPIFSAAALLAAARRIEPDPVEDVRTERQAMTMTPENPWAPP